MFFVDSLIAELSRGSLAGHVLAVLWPGCTNALVLLGCRLAPDFVPGFLIRRSPEGSQDCLLLKCRTGLGRQTLPRLRLPCMHPTGQTHLYSYVPHTRRHILFGNVIFSEFMDGQVPLQALLFMVDEGEETSLHRILGSGCCRSTWSLKNLQIAWICDPDAWRSWPHGQKRPSW